MTVARTSETLYPINACHGGIYCGVVSGARWMDMAGLRRLTLVGTSRQTAIASASAAERE